jgi:glycosyltransferase involved in cell wall biosynthesis
MSSRPRLIVREPSTVIGPSCAGADCITLAEFRHAVLSGAYFKMLKHYSGVELHLYSLGAHGRLWQYALLLPPLSRGETVIRDTEGGCLQVRLSLALRLLAEAGRDRVASASLTSKIDRSLDRISASTDARTYDSSKPPLYLRTDFWFGEIAGGAIGHVVGVVNNLGEFADGAVFVTTDLIPTVADAVETHVIRPGSRFRNLRELRMAAFNDTLVPQVETLLGTRRPGFVYHRNSEFNFSGLALAVRYSVPLVLEYNGPMVWMATHWGRRYRHEALAERIELANLHGADLIVAGSVPLRDELVGRGIDADKILVNPTGVNTDVYSPSVDGGPVRRRLGLEDKTVVGFVGTFRQWHGADVLAEAFGRLIERAPDLRDNVRLLMVGDAVTMPEVVGSLERHGVLDLAVLTGLVPQSEAPAHLAACDVLASPHVPNVDGTPFFGSPMKLFEYMAMGKGIVASDLDQIGEVLENGRTALLVRPADVDALAAGLERLIREPELRARLGAAARQEAVDHHTWSQHTRLIVDALRDRCGVET